VSLLFVGAIFGGLSLHLVAERIGRKQGLLFAYSLFTIFLAFSAVSKFVCFY
jgi:predicted MFS family arabinose efflux permease